MADSTRVTTDEAERIVEAARALGPQIRAAVEEWNRTAVYQPPLCGLCSRPGPFG